MIHLFGCENFYSFAEEASISFVINSATPKNDGSFLTPSDKHLSKIEMVIGPNASGKTNLLKVLPFIKWLLLSSFQLDPESKMPIKPFKSKENEAKPSKLFVEFECEETIYSYTCVLNQNLILDESLYERNLSKKNTTKKKVFERIWDYEEGKYKLESDRFKLPANFTAVKRQNASLISLSRLIEHPIGNKISDYWEKIETNVLEAGWIGDKLMPGSFQNTLETFLEYKRNPSLKKEAEALLSNFDLGIKDFEIDIKNKDNEINLEVFANHEFNGNNVKLPIRYESAGTKQLLILLKTILIVLAKGGVAIIDEFDVNLHPDIIHALYELFISPESNKKHAQFLFSSHSFSLLASLDKFQVTLVEKNDRGGSECWRLDEMTGVRSDENYYAKYIAGAYGAKPKLN